VGPVGSRRVALRALLAAAIVTAATGASARRAWAGKAVDGVVNLNTAPVEVLALLPGIGPAKAGEIVRYRKRRPFRTVDELVRIKGIGRKMVRRLRAHLAVAGPTTASAAIARAGPPPSPAAPPPLSAPRPRPICAPAPPAARPPAARRAAPERWPSHTACARPR
jgi:competence protein ComEA